MLSSEQPQFNRAIHLVQYIPLGAEESNIFSKEKLSFLLAWTDLHA